VKKDFTKKYKFTQKSRKPQKNLFKGKYFANERALLFRGSLPVRDRKQAFIVCRSKIPQSRCDNSFRKIENAFTSFKLKLP
jgi:hypothetical protein